MDANDERDEQYESADDNIKLDGDEFNTVIAEDIEAEAIDQEANKNPWASHSE